MNQKLFIETNYNNFVSQNLKNLTLHGNPLEEATCNYRWTILKILPTVKNLDFSFVTPGDREKAKVLAAFKLKKSYW